jgi:hypothetical protein
VRAVAVSTAVHTVPLSAGHSKPWRHLRTKVVRQWGTNQTQRTARARRSRSNTNPRFIARRHWGLGFGRKDSSLNMRAWFYSSSSKTLRTWIWKKKLEFETLTSRRGFTVPVRRH